MDKKTILIVDDNADTRLLLSARLKAHQYHTVFAADALQAMSVAQKERPNAILLDLGLPGGNGLIVLQRFKANTSLSGIPIIIVTAEDPLVAEAGTRGWLSRVPSKAGGSRQAHGGGATSHWNNLIPALQPLVTLWPVPCHARGTGGETRRPAQAESVGA